MRCLFHVSTVIFTQTLRNKARATVNVLNGLGIAVNSLVYLATLLPILWFHKFHFMRLCSFYWPGEASRTIRFDRNVVYSAFKPILRWPRKKYTKAIRSHRSICQRVYPAWKPILDLERKKHTKKPRIISRFERAFFTGQIDLKTLNSCLFKNFFFILRSEMCAWT